MALADFFVDYIRKVNLDKNGRSCHGFKSQEEENNYLIYNYDPIYAGVPPLNLTLAQIYIFY